MNSLTQQNIEYSYFFQEHVTAMSRLTEFIFSKWCVITQTFRRPFSMIFHDRENISEIINSQINITHWGRVTHICVSKLTIIGSDNALSPCRHQDIIWTNAGILLIGPLSANSSEILIKIQNFLFTKMHLRISSAKWRPFCPVGDELIYIMSNIAVCAMAADTLITLGGLFNNSMYQTHIHH